MNDMGDFAKGFKTMSVEELFYRGEVMAIRIISRVNMIRMVIL